MACADLAQLLWTFLVPFRVYQLTKGRFLAKIVVSAGGKFGGSPHPRYLQLSLTRDCRYRPTAPESFQACKRWAVPSEIAIVAGLGSQRLWEGTADGWSFAKRKGY